MRDLVRTREDAVTMQRQARQQLAALLLRNEIRYVGKTHGPQAHRRWIASLKLPQAAQQIAFEEYVEAVSEATERVERLTQAIEQELAHWRWRRWSARCRLARHPAHPCGAHHAELGDLGAL